MPNIELTTATDQQKKDILDALGAPQFAVNSNGVVTGIQGPTGVQSGVGTKLVAMYEAQRAEDDASGPLLLARTRLTVGNTPVLTSSTTIPSSDATDAAGQRISPFGSPLTVDATLSQRIQAKRWLSGFSIGLRVWPNGPANRASSSLGQFGANGNNDQDAALGYGIDNNGIVFDCELDGDVLYLGVLGGTKFSIWVNNNRITGSSVASTNMTHDAADETYRAAANGYIKIKFSSVARRRITVYSWGNASPGDFWVRNTATILPWNEQKIRWLHLGDSFSQGTGAAQMNVGLASWMSSAFGGWDIDFVNISQGGTSFGNTAFVNLPGVAPVASKKPSIRQQYLLHGASNDPHVITMLIGHNDANVNLPLMVSELSTMLSTMRVNHPSSIIAVFGTNWSPGVNANAAATEAAIASAISQNPGILWFPLQTNVSGAFMRGTGRVGATTGNGNADIYNGTDDTHPSDAGHRAYGQMMARRLYSALKSQFV